MRKEVIHSIIFDRTILDCRNQGLKISFEGKVPTISRNEPQLPTIKTKDESSQNFIKIRSEKLNGTLNPKIKVSKSHLKQKYPQLTTINRD